jgi:hypothetical protein
MFRKTVTFLCLLAACASHAASYTWNGSASELWSNPSNWTPAGVPQSGDSLTIPPLFGQSRVVVNDIPGLTLHSLKGQRTIYREPDLGWKPLGPRNYGQP